MKIKKNIAVSASGLIFNPNTGESFAVNPIGAEIIGWINEGLLPEEITAKITVKYNIDRTTAEKDLEDFTGFITNYSLTENG